MEGTKKGRTDEDGDKICDACEAEIADGCPDCGAAVHDGTYGEYICMLSTLIRLFVSLIQALGVIA